jgi:hypothetical protein
MAEKILKLNCFYDRSLSSDKIDEFSHELIDLCKKHGVVIDGATMIAPSTNPYMDHTWDVRGLVLGNLNNEKHKMPKKPL